MAKLSTWAKFLARLKTHAKALKAELHALIIAYRDPRTPWVARAFALLVLASAFSPIDLIPDFIPVLGYLDDLILLPLGIALAIKLIPPIVMDDARKTVTQFQGRSFGWMGAVIIGVVWLIGVAIVVGLAIIRFK